MLYKNYSTTQRFNSILLIYTQPQKHYKLQMSINMSPSSQAKEQKQGKYNDVQDQHHERQSPREKKIGKI